MLCPAFDAAAPYAPSLVEAIDCRVAALGQDGFAALGTAGGPAATLLAGLTTILVGLTGYRLIFGERLAISHGALIVLRIGFVLALATQWPAYQATVYDVVVRGPDELLATLSGAAGGDSRATPARVQAVWRGLDMIAHPRSLAAAPAPTPASSAAPQTAAPGSTAGAQRTTPEPSIPQGWSLRPSEQGRTSAASIILLISSMAGLLGVRLIAAALLALGPLFIACALFDGVRGLFEGWVRALLAVLVGSVLVSVTLLTELAILEPQVLAFAQALVDGASPPPAAAGEIFATACIFALIVMLAIGFAIRVGAGFRYPRWNLPLSATASSAGGALPATASAATTGNATSTRVPEAPPSRAAAVADSLRIAVERENGNLAGRREISVRDPARNDTPILGLGQAGLASRKARASAASERRDRAA